MGVRIEIKFNDGVYVNAAASLLGLTDEQAVEAMKAAEVDAERALKLGDLVKVYAMRLHNSKVGGRC